MDIFLASDRDYVRLSPVRIGHNQQVARPHKGSLDSRVGSKVAGPDAQAANGDDPIYFASLGGQRMRCNIVAD